MRAAYNLWLKGRMVPDLEVLKTFEAYLKMERFKEIENRDLSKNVRHSVIRGRLIGIPNLFSIARKILDKKYEPLCEPLKDVDYATAILASFLGAPFVGLINVITYNAISAVKK